MIFSLNVTNAQETVDLVTFTKEILNGKLHFFNFFFEPCQVSTMELVAKKS